MRALLALPLFALSACSAQAEDACVGEIELLLQERDSFVATQMEALKTQRSGTPAARGAQPSPEEIQLYADFMNRLEAANNRIAVRMRDCPAFVRKAAERGDAAPAVDMTPADLPPVDPLESE